MLLTLGLIAHVHLYGLRHLALYPHLYSLPTHLIYKLHHSICSREVIAISFGSTFSQTTDGVFFGKQCTRRVHWQCLNAIRHPIYRLL